MNEDECRIRMGSSPEVLASVRGLAINMLNNCDCAKGGNQRKMKRAALSTRFLEDVLKGAPLLLKDAAS